jgi:hypothetical protein
MADTSQVRACTPARYGDNRNAKVAIELFWSSMAAE